MYDVNAKKEEVPNNPNANNDQQGGKEGDNPTGNPVNNNNQTGATA